MKCFIRTFSLTLALLLAFATANAQGTLGAGRLSGNFQIDAQTYTVDSLIGADNVPSEEMLANSWLNLLYSNSNFTIGMRYEAYLNPLLGIDQRYGNEQGIAYRFASYNSDFIDVTAGDFYEQFGSGMILRAYEDRQLGLDNAIDGLRVRVKPAYGIDITGIIGRQRKFWTKSQGIVRGINSNVYLNDLFEGLGYNYIWSIGAGAVSKFQEDLDSRLILPQNVFAWSGRANLIAPKFSLEAEYSYKINDPNETNSYTYNKGTGIILSGAYYIEGFSLGLNYHWVDNMDFRSEYQAQGNDVMIGYIPPLTRQHAYRFAASYPYATQLNGESGLQVEATYSLPDNSLLGGKYGTTIDANFSFVNNIDTVGIDNFTYESDLFSMGDRQYFRDFNFDIKRKFSDEFKMNLNYLNIVYDKDIIENEGAAHYGKVYNNVLILDGTYRINENHALRTELQHMWSEQDSALTSPDNINGNWAMILLEYTIAPHYFITFYNEFNYGNDDEDRQLHYPNVSFAYITGSTRISTGYGRQRGGVLCVGGVCREVPASNGFNLTISSSF